MSQQKKDGSVRLTILIADQAHLRDLCGPHHSHLALIENAFGVRAESQGGGVELQGDASAARLAQTALQHLAERLERGEPVGASEVRAEIARVNKGGGQPARILLPGRRGIVDARAGAQSEYLDALLSEDTPLVFGVGPAGTGKTFLAVAAGTTALLEGRVSRLVVARPAVEAGERLGFLPGDLTEKVDPYLMPIWDALRGLLGAQQLERRRGAGEIEVAPLAFMRGRTLADAFVIVDEAQNATIMQMKMVLTRLGEGARMAVTGDPSQVDLPPSQPSGLTHALGILDDVKGVKIVRFTADDVMRHALVSRIVRAYDKDAAQKRKRTGPGMNPDPDSRTAASWLRLDAIIDEPRWTEALGDPEAMARQIAVACLAADPNWTQSAASLSVLFADDAQLRALNGQFRAQDNPTNVLSFPSLSPDDGLGDIAIAFETTAREATEQGKSFQHHAMHLIAHGMLHLLGYDHRDDSEAEVMEGLERGILAHFGIPDPYAVSQSGAQNGIGQ